MKGRTSQAEEFPIFFLQETAGWVLMPRMPMTREQMKQPSCLRDFASCPIKSAQWES